MGNFGDDLAQSRKLAGASNKDKSDQLIAKICPENFFSKQKPAKLSFNSLEILSIMPKWLSLAHGSFIEDRHHASYKLVIEFTSPDDDALLFGSANHVSRFRVDLVLPPENVILNGNCGDRVVLHAVVMFYLDVR